MWKLAQKTIDIIRQAEQEADQLEKDTAAECESIVQAAREQAARHFEITTDQSRPGKGKESARQKGEKSPDNCSRLRYSCRIKKQRQKKSRKSLPYYIGAILIDY